MSNYIDLDSIYRDRVSFPNPFRYTLAVTQVEAWNRAPRTVSANSSRPSSRVLEFTESLKIKKIILPFAVVTYNVTDYNGTVSTPTHTADLQRIYLDIHTTPNNDKGHISSIDNHAMNYKFVLFQKKIQYDSTGTAKWVHFESKDMNQVMRFERNSPVTITITQETFKVLNIVDASPTDPAISSVQNYILTEVTPYFRDGNFQNHGVGLTQF
jgi:hypothetical protein